jgi:hypothetical protein
MQTDDQAEAPPANTFHLRKLSMGHIVDIAMNGMDLGTSG